MKKIQFILLAALIATTASQAQLITEPGWFQAQNQTANAPARDPLSDQTPGESDSGQTASAFYVPATPIAEAITPQIQALADGLQHDPQVIFNYVHDHIRFALYFGSKKGAQLTLLEKSGNDFDQCALLVALLRAAGYTNVQYQFGWQEIPYDDPYGQDYDLRHWWQLTLTNSNWTTTWNYVTQLAVNRGYPIIYHFADGNYFDIQRTWVALTIDSAIYNLDPAFKVSEPVTSLFSLTNALGNTSAGISNALMSAAAGTNTGSYVSNLAEATLRGTLAGYTTNVLNYIRSNSPNSDVLGILGGWQTTPAYDPWDFVTYTLFYVDTFSGQMPVLSWANEPTNLMSTLAVTFAGTNYQWLFPQLQGQRLSLKFDAAALAQLWLDDTNVAQHATSGSSGSTNVVLAITHPFGAWDITNNLFVPNPTNFANQTVTNSYQSSNATYALLYAFDPDWGWLQQRENKLDAYLQQGLTNGSRQVVSETLNVMGLNWMLQTAQVDRMLAAELGMLPQFLHRLGRMAQESGKGYYIDVYMQVESEFPNGGDDPAHLQSENTAFDLWVFFASALEHGLIEQLQNTNLVGASTVKMLQIANTNGQAIYLASSTNWTTAFNVKSKLVSYDITTLNAISNFISKGYYVLLPQNGSNHVAGTTGWAGYGYEARRPFTLTNFDTRMIISGGYNGAYISDSSAVPDTAYTDLSGVSQAQYYTINALGSAAQTGADPVDLANGTFQVESTDLSLGQVEPRGLTLSRYYNGTRRYANPAGMAAGWIHNYAINAASVAAPRASLGGTTPAQAAPMLAAIASAVAFYNSALPNPKNWTVAALIAKWGVDQITKGGVSISLGKDTVQFVLQPNGVFTPPANCAMTLTKANGAYSVQERHGRTFNFDTTNRLASIVDQYSVSNSLTYNASNWVSAVTDWKNRSLNFNYTGSQLTSISDGSRAVSYGYSTAYSPQGDLVSVTDPEGKTSTYVYDTNHQIIATLDALSRLVVSNRYDTQGRVTTQYTQGDTNKTWRIFQSGWRTSEMDPAGSLRKFFYDDQGRLVQFGDQLLQFTFTFYDGQNHVVETISPLNETNQFVYDGNHNLLQKIDPLGFTNQFVYDNQFNLVRSVDQRGNPSTFGYNAQFSLTGSTNGAGDWVTLAYNASDGTLSSRTDPGGQTSYTYDSFGLLNSVTYPGSLGSESFLNSSFGDVTNHTNPRGFATSFQYNLRRELTNAIAPTNITARITYDAADNQQSSTDPRGFTTTSFWSPTRHVTNTVFPATPQGTPATTNVYDSRDWLARSLDPLHNPTLFTNDIAGRLVSATDPLLRTTRFAFDGDGHKTATTNAALEVTTQQWDARGQMTRLTDPATNNVLRAFDSAGNQVTLTNRNGKKWQFQFDAANRPAITITPLNRTNSVVFDNRGLPYIVGQPSGNAATNLYDARARLTNSTDALGVRAFAYDANNNVTNITQTISSQQSTISSSYDAYDRVSSYTDADGNLIQYRYDASGNMTNLAYPGNRTVSYAFDSLNRVTNITDWANGKTTITYDLASRVTSITRPNGTVRLMNYDADGEVTNIVEKTTWNFPIAFFALNWTNTGNIAWEFAAPLPHTNMPAARTMTFDSDNRLATFNGVTVTNDLDGNMTFGPQTNNNFFAYAYDARNRLVRAGLTKFGYDPAGNRTSITNGTNITRFVVNPNAKLSQVLMRTKGGTTNYYIYGLGLLYEITETATSTNMLTYHYDYRGSTVAITDGNGLPTDRIEYSAYGLMTYRAGTNDTPFLYNGRYGVMTDSTGLLYMRARYYNPYLCRFANADPSGFSGGLNFYAYADGNPVSKLDPFGLNSEWNTGHPVVNTILNGLDKVTDLAAAAYTQHMEDQLNLARAVGDYVIEHKIGQSSGGSEYNFTAITTMASFLVPALGAELLEARLAAAAETTTMFSRQLGMQPATTELLDAMQAHGRTITIATEGSEALRFLDAVGAEASAGGPGHLSILLRENPSGAAAMEEFLHGTQDRLGIIDRLGVQGAENHVTDFMTRHSGLLGLKP